MATCCFKENLIKSYIEMLPENVLHYPVWAAGNSTELLAQNTYMQLNTDPIYNFPQSFFVLGWSQNGFVYFTLRPFTNIYILKIV